MTMPDDYSATTRNIRVRVRSIFLPDQSQPEAGRYVWAYLIRIDNLGPETVQLMQRTWRIIDGKGRAHHVHGDGVIGQQPVLAPGDSHEYNSGTPLETPSGFMSGQYHMVVTQTGEMFDIEIPSFSLDSPHDAGAVH
jgi:ApaG protein